MSAFRRFALVAALCMLWAAGGARADATVSYTFSNQSALQIIHTDGSVTPVGPDFQGLRAGETALYRFDYTVHLTDDGLPNAKIGDGGFYGPGPRPGVCDSPDCPGWLAINKSGHREPEFITLTGQEMAFINIFTRPPCLRDCAPWDNFSFDQATFMTGQGTEPDDITQSGTFTVFYSVSHDAGDGFFSVNLPQVAVDAVAFSVPEPGTYALMLMGVLVLAWRTRASLLASAGTRGTPRGPAARRSRTSAADR
jgi:hypothetical protein